MRLAGLSKVEILMGSLSRIGWVKGGERVTEREAHGPSSAEFVTPGIRRFCTKTGKVVVAHLHHQLHPHSSIFPPFFLFALSRSPFLIIKNGRHQEGWEDSRRVRKYVFFSLLFLQTFFSLVIHLLTWHSYLSADFLMGGVSAVCPYR